MKKNSIKKLLVGGLAVSMVFSMSFMAISAFEIVNVANECILDELTMGK